MRSATGATRITGGQLVDGTGEAAVPDAALLIEDGRITYAGAVSGAPQAPPDAAEIDARGGTILPGLVEAHFHPTYFDVADLEDLDIKYPVEYVSLLASVNARLALECGYTAARSGGSLFNVDVWLKKAIEAKALPSFEQLCATSTASFYGRGAGRNYAQARYLMLWLQQHGKLRSYYRAFRENADEDPTGYATLRTILGADDMEAWQERWEAWALALIR